MIKLTKFLVLVSAAVFILTGSIAYGQTTQPVQSTAAAPAKSGWEFEVTPYMFMPTMKGDMTTKGIDASVDMSFGDILSNLKFGGMLFLQAKKDTWGLFLDTSYMKLQTDVQGTRSFTSSGPLGRITVDTLLDAELSMEQLVIELGGFYQLAKFPVGQDKGGMMYLDLLLGARYWALSGDIDIGLVIDGNHNTIARNISESGNKQWIDPFIGLRTRIQFTKDLALALRGDIGGFGVGSEFSWNASTYLGYSVSQMVTLYAGYRALSVDYRDGSGIDRFIYNMTFHGPAIGVGFRF